MDSFNVIAQLEGKLKAFVSLRPHEHAIKCWNMDVQLYYEGDHAGNKRFTLHGYDLAEAEHLARNIKSDAYLMREIDEYLWGESD
jgi:hypothetical protein